MAQITVIGIGKKKGAPPPPPAPAKKRAAMPPPPPADPTGDPAAADPADPDAAGQGEPDDDDKAISPAEVGYGENDLCQDCANMGNDDNCAKYNFPVTETGHCLGGYEPKGGGADGGDQPSVAVAA